MTDMARHSTFFAKKKNIKKKEERRIEERVFYENAAQSLTVTNKTKTTITNQ